MLQNLPANNVFAVAFFLRLAAAEIRFSFLDAPPPSNWLESTIADGWEIRYGIAAPAVRGKFADDI